MHDTVIVGAGPAGVSAALTLRARNKTVLLVSNDPLTSNLAKAARIENYPGMPAISGIKMVETFLEQANEQGVEYLNGRVTGIMPFGDQFMVSIGSEVEEAGSVVLALGTAPADTIVGEDEFLGRGVSYCATCDGMLYRDRKVCVIGGGAEAEKEAVFLAEIGCEVTYLARKAVGEDSVLNTGTVKIEQATARHFEIQGSDKVSALIADGVTYPCEAVFVLRPAIAPANLIFGLEMDGAFIRVDEHMQTSIAGVFAAGDCTGKPLQVAKAVGQGQLAAFAAVDYLEKKNQ